MWILPAYRSPRFIRYMIDREQFSADGRWRSQRRGREFEPPAVHHFFPSLVEPNPFSALVPWPNVAFRRPHTLSYIFYCLHMLVTRTSPIAARCASTRPDPTQRSVARLSLIHISEPTRLLS